VQNENTAQNISITHCTKFCNLSSTIIMLTILYLCVLQGFCQNGINALITNSAVIVGFTTGVQRPSETQ
jgi:hypothetical protein